MTSTFPAIAPALGATKKRQPTQKRVQFGDGYEQVLRWGLNQNPAEWTLTFRNITDVEAASIENFLDNRADDGAAFNWSPPDESSTYKWRCDAWTKQIPVNGRNTITVTFRQVFDP